MTVANKVQSKVPQLRFPEFDELWRLTTLGEACSKIQDGNYGGEYPSASEFVVSGIPFLTSKAIGSDSELIERKVDYITDDKHAVLKKAQLKLNDVLFTNRGSNVGTIGFVDNRIAHGNIGPQLTLLRLNGEKSVAKFMFYVMQSPRIRKQIQSQDSGSAMNFFGIGATSKFRFYFPDLIEQNKNASFLSTVDKKISLLKQKHEQLVQYKKGIMQQLFSQKLRFKDDNGQDFPNWEVTKFKQHFERVTRKNKINNLNVLTISGQRGLINQQKYFNKSVSAQDVTGYYLMNKGEFAYNKSYSKGYPMGAIKRLNNYDQGVVSTLYICFKSKNGDDRFWEQYFEAGLLNREIQKIAQEGARNHGLLNVSVKEFFDDMNIHSPREYEQGKIADFLESFDKKINLAQQQIEQTQTYKQGLLQQMFV